MSSDREMQRKGNQAEQIFELIDKIGDLDDPNEIMDRFAAYLSQYGFSSFLISGLPDRTQRLEPHILLNGWSSEWFERYREKNHYKSDPVAQYCFETETPFFWDELPGKLLMTRESRLIMDEATDFGLNKGLSVPLYGLFGFQSIVTMAGRKIEVSPEERMLIHMVSIYAHAAAQSAMRKAGNVSKSRLLTTRERDVLKWVAEGKSHWEIGRIIGTSEAAVTAHIARVKRKLQARTAAQAIVAGMRRGELTL